MGSLLKIPDEDDVSRPVATREKELSAIGGIREVVNRAAGELRHLSRRTAGDRLFPQVRDAAFGTKVGDDSWMTSPVGATIREGELCFDGTGRRVDDGVRGLLGRIRKKTNEEMRAILRNVGGSSPHCTERRARAAIGRHAHQAAAG